MMMMMKEEQYCLLRSNCFQEIVMTHFLVCWCKTNLHYLVDQALALAFFLQKILFHFLIFHPSFWYHKMNTTNSCKKLKIKMKTSLWSLLYSMKMKQKKWVRNKREKQNKSILLRKNTYKKEDSKTNTSGWNEETRHVV